MYQKHQPQILRQNWDKQQIHPSLPKTHLRNNPTEQRGQPARYPRVARTFEHYHDWDIFGSYFAEEKGSAE